MIDICKSFDNYTKDFDMNNEKIKLKYNHSYRVMKLSEKYAKELGFNKEDIYLAKVIGLLHDIGRFKQLEIYNTFYDYESIDHADLGVKILFEDNLIKEFYEDSDDYEIIKFAIKNHNKLFIENTNNKRALMHAKLIRDTDKIDIIFLEGFLDEIRIRPTNENISNNVIEAIKNHEQVSRNSSNNNNDKIANSFAFVFDINYDICLKEIKDNYKEFYKRINSTDKFDDIYNEVMHYIDNRIKDLD